MSAWPMKQLRHIAKVNPATPASLDLAEEVSFLPMEAIGVFTPIESSRTRPVHEVRAGYTYFEDGDVAFAKVTPCFENGKGAIFSGLTGGKGFGTTEITVLRPAPSTDPRFLAYLVQSQAFVSFGESVMQGSGGLKRVPDNQVRGFKHVVPSPAVQTAVANYLDRQTAAIDALIAKKEELLVVLDQYRQAVIMEAVNGSLGANPLEWKKLSRIATIKGGTGFPPSEQGVSGQELQFYKVNALAKADAFGRLIEGEDTVSLATARRLGAHVFTPGTVVLAKVGAALLLNRFRSLTAPACLDNNLMGVTAKKGLLPKYLKYVLETKDIGFLVNPGAVPSVGASQIGAMSVWVPNEHRQQELIEILDRKTAAVDSLKSKCVGQVEVLKKYRASVISASVTGKCLAGSNNAK